MTFAKVGYLLEIRVKGKQYETHTEKGVLMWITEHKTCYGSVRTTDSLDLKSLTIISVSVIKSRESFYYYKWPHKYIYDVSWLTSIGEIYSSLNNVIRL